MRAKSFQSCLPLRPMDCSPPGFSVHGILQAKILEWVAMPSSRRSSWPRDQTHCLLWFFYHRQILYCWATGEVQVVAYIVPSKNDGSFSICRPMLIHDLQRTCLFKQTEVTSFTGILVNYDPMKKNHIRALLVFIHNYVYGYLDTHTESRSKVTNEKQQYLLCIKSIIIFTWNTQTTNISRCALIHSCYRQGRLRHIKLTHLTVSRGVDGRIRESLYLESSSFLAKS